MTQAVTDLARLVRDKRRAHGLTQRQLAAATGMTLSRLRDVEQGRISQLDEAFLLQLAGPLHLSADEVRGALRAESKGLQIEVLGPLTVRWDGSPLSIGSPQRRAVLGLLALFAPEPVSRQLTARLMLALTGSGQQVTALNLFEQTRRRFDEVLGLTPDAEVAEAHRRVLRQESARAL